MATEQLGICENCRQLAMCEMVEIAPCVRIRLCRVCRAAKAMLSASAQQMRLNFFLSHGPHHR
jgi:hypothetical protein